MFTSRQFVGVACLISLLFFGGLASAETVSLKIRIFNPSVSPSVKDVSSALPKRVKPEHITDLGGLELRYNPKTEVYEVYAQVSLRAGERRDLEVTIDDIWTIPDESLEHYLLHSRTLAQGLSGSADQASAEETLAVIEAQLTKARELQDSSSLARVPAAMHIKAFERNLHEVKLALFEVAKLENLSVSRGLNPREIIGVSMKPIADKDRRAVPSDGSPAAVMRLVIKNPSALKRTENVHAEMPAEIGEDDILDAAGLKMGRDDTTGRMFLYMNGIPLEAGETKSFEVQVRNRWSLSDAYVEGLVGRATNLHALAYAGENVAVQDLAEVITESLAVMGDESRPEDLNSAYIAYFRGLSERYVEVEKKLNRLDEMMNPETAPSPQSKPVGSFTTKSVSLETLLAVIYGIIGFLGFVGVVALVRWMGQSKRED